MHGLLNQPWGLPEQQHNQHKADDHEGDGRQSADQQANLWLKHFFLLFPLAAVTGSDN